MLARSGAAVQSGSHMVKRSGVSRCKGLWRRGRLPGLYLQEGRGADGSRLQLLGQELDLETGSCEPDEENI